ncbi:copper amine oxidase N-terminal domain-containing protein [Paenibacillus guangzhouensis]|uniref:copper amine oxidase N-terminal domain-containing protein n=1 Tax=Paenibacillus guangzhouensis TaxID=1473112 RepID=UPI001266C280|nr:copper amine oxidase N-terminal domain-containing protein [Paenibacillus guangzhouensis]
MSVLVAAHILIFDAVPATPFNVYMNGQQEGNVIMSQGHTLVPLSAFDDPTRLIYTFDDMSKTVDITNKVNLVCIQLSDGAQEAIVNGKKVKLDAQVTLKDGRIFVPLRFLSERLGGSVSYDKEGKKVVVRTPSEQERFKRLMDGDLTEARKIAISLPVIYGKNALQPQGEGFSIKYTFPKGEALRYYKEYKGLVNYVEINADGIAELIWQGDSPQMEKELREKGNKPAKLGEAVYFIQKSEYTYYGTIDEYGKSTELGQINRSEKNNTSKQIVPIDEEKTFDTRQSKSS